MQTQVHEVESCATQYLNIERLGHIGIGTIFQTLQVGVLVGLGSEQDDRDVIEIDVLLDLFAQGDTIHFRHHHVADYKVGLLAEDILQSLLSVAACVDMEIGRQFLAQIVAYLGIVIDNEQVEART